MRFAATRLGALVGGLAVVLMGCPSIEAPVDGGSADSGSGGLTDAGSADAGADAVDSGTPPVARDLDIALVRLNTDGALDSTFGDGGIATVDFGTATGGARDTVYGFDKDSAGRLVLFGSTKAATRSDSDRFVARFTASGALDSTFATAGVFRLDLAQVNDNARHGFVQADGKIMASGYTALPTGVVQSDGGIQTANHIVLLRLNADGQADSTFGDAGVVATAQFVPLLPATTLWGMAEAYAAVRQSSGKYVTAGYGRVAASGTVDQVGFRYTNAGEVDLSWGTNGAYVLNLLDGDDRARHAAALADDRVAMVGSAVTADKNIDALVSMVATQGALDLGFNTTGYKTWSFGRADEAFWGTAVGPGGMTLAAAGYRVGTANTTENDDGILLLLPISTGAPAEFAQAVPMSTGAHDRFYGVAWDGAKVVAAGFVRDGSDTKMAVARFNGDGTPDTTFGTGGVVQVNVTVAGGTEETARWVVVQNDGKIVIAGPTEH